LETDQVPSQRRVEMKAAPEPNIEHRDAAFAWRVADGQRRWKTAIFLRQAEFTNIHHLSAS
jgi:hypothetical protein